MSSVFACVTGQHDVRLVLLAVAVCVLACYTAIGLIQRVRHARGARMTLVWTAAAGLVLGGGIWATHFVAMLAYLPGMTIVYDLTLTALSVVVAIVISIAGFAIVLLGHRLVVGGAIVGLAIGAMHFIGIASMQAPATKIWDVGYVVAALATGVAGAAVAFWFCGLRRHPVVRAVGPMVLVLAICGLHFTAMTALSWRADPSIPEPVRVVAPDVLAFAVAATMVVIVGLGLFSAILDRHLARRAAAETERLRAYVTELEATKRELEARTAQATSAMEAAAASSHAKSQFLATMSHELRTPLNAIIGFSSMQADEVLGPMGNAQYRDYANDIRGAGEHLLAMINDILDLARMDTDNLELDEGEIDVDGLIRSVARLVEGQASAAGLTLRVDVEPGLPALSGDERRLRQVLINLLSNAIKFTPAPGEIVLRARLEESGGLAIEVADTGIGMTRAEIKVAMERFGQVENGLARKFEGTGLGLPLAMELILRHGGRLDLDSEPGVGTTATVRLSPDRLSALAEVA